MCTEVYLATRWCTLESTQDLHTMILIAKTVPLHEKEGVLVELSPLLAFCALFEKSPRPVMVSYGITSATVYIQGTEYAAAMILNHASLCEGIFAIRDGEVDFRYTVKIGTPSNSTAQSYPYHAILDTLFATNTSPGSELDLRCYNHIRSLIASESKEDYFLHRRHPYRPPLQVLREWGLSCSDRCVCFHVSCEDCLVSRWKSTSTLPKDPSSIPPSRKPQCADSFRAPPNGVSYDGGWNPFNWSYERICRLSSIW